MWDSHAQAGYSYDANRKVMNTYDVPQAVKAKCDYINEKGLGGVILCESMLFSNFSNVRFCRCSI